MALLPRYRHFLLLLLALFALAFAGLVYLIREKTEDYALAEARKLALNALLVHRATHAYVTKIQRPEIYRLKDEGKLYQDYFSPMTMSFTFISRSLKDLLNVEREKHALEPIYFKLASENPRNPINTADTMETRLLRRMNREGLQEFQDVVSLEGQKWLYLAVPIERSTPGCMKCHGDPKDAPGELLALYGDKAGFFEDPDTIRALISIRVPLQGNLAAAQQMAYVLSLGTFLTLSSIYALIAFFIRRIDRQEKIILQQNDDLAHLSVTDSLTGVLNRFGLTRRLDEQISLAKRFRQPFSLLLLDLDHFKHVNDQYGHQTGDSVLKQFSAVIQSNIRASDIFGRWGGEEFLVITPNNDLEDARQLAEKLRAAIAQTAFKDELSVTMSVGVSQYREGEMDSEAMERADKALYQAKETGRDRVVGL